MNVDLLTEYAKLCGISYNSPDIAINQYQGMGYEAKVLAQPMQIEQIYVLKKDSKLFIVLAGSNQLSDWITNFFAIPGWYVHPGYSEIATGLMDSVELEYIDSKATELILLGHSKGGGIAAILGDYLAHLPVNIVSFGAPRIASESYATTYLHKRYTRVVHAEDLVAKLPFNFMRYRHCGVAVIWNGTSYDKSLTAWIKAEKENPTFKLFLNPIKCFKIHNSYWK